ncbi:MAG: hypothetical protein UH103_07960 [Paludibacteraceae bacterium]|nr:hypothetical protein [Paludibacteraceae bacterium]
MKIFNIVNAGGGSATELAVNTTWAELKAMRDNSQLTVGCLYRITDYETIISGEDVQSAGHVFDIIVLATDVNQLSEDAMAVHSARDTEGYFANAKLEAWELKYCLDNDTAKFAWASDGVEKWIIDLSGITFNAILISTDDHTYEGFPYKFTVNVENQLAEFYFAHLELEEGEGFIPNKFVSGGIVQDDMPISLIHINSEEGKGVIYKMIDEHNNSCGYDFKNVQFKRYKITATKENPSEEECIFYNQYVGLKPKEEPQTLPDGYDIDINDYKYLYTFSIITNVDVKDNSLGLDLTSDGIGFFKLCKQNTIKENISVFSGLAFAFALNNNVFVSNYISPEYIENLGVCNNELDFSCEDNTFLNAIRDNKLGTSCVFNLIGHGCYNIIMSNNCYNNTINGEAYSNIFMSDCCYNWLGKDCNKNLFGQSSTNNILQQNCYYLSIGNFCYNNVICNSFSITLFDGVNHVSIGDYNGNTKNAQVLNGTRDNQINFEKNANYTQIAGLDSQGNLKIWNPADLVQ